MGCCFLNAASQRPPTYRREHHPPRIVIPSCLFLAMHLKALVLEIFVRQKPVQDRTCHAPTSILGVDEIVPKSRRSEREGTADR